MKGKTKSKKAIILDLFKNAEWLESHNSRRVKILNYECFRDAGLSPTWEYGEKYCDVIYAKRVIESLGHKVLIAMGFYVYENMKGNADSGKKLLEWALKDNSMPMSIQEFNSKNSQL
jgi:hypothetical protein